MEHEEARLTAAGLVFAMLQQRSSGRWIVWDWKRNRIVSTKRRGYDTMKAAVDAAIADLDPALRR